MRLLRHKIFLGLLNEGMGVIGAPSQQACEYRADGAQTVVKVGDEEPAQQLVLLVLGPPADGPVVPLLVDVDEAGVLELVLPPRRDGEVDAHSRRGFHDMVAGFPECALCRFFSQADNWKGEVLKFNITPGLEVPVHVNNKLEPRYALTQRPAQRVAASL
jgi:hypothetical protein